MIYASHCGLRTPNHPYGESVRQPFLWNQAPSSQPPYLSLTSDLFNAHTERSPLNFRNTLDLAFALSNILPYHFAKWPINYHLEVILTNLNDPSSITYSLPMPTLRRLLRLDVYPFHTSHRRCIQLITVIAYAARVFPLDSSLLCLPTYLTTNSFCILFHILNRPETANRANGSNNRAFHEKPFRYGC